MSVPETFQRGREILDPIMRHHGFVFAEGASGTGSGGAFASGHYTSGDRGLELHFRSSWGSLPIIWGR